MILQKFSFVFLLTTLLLSTLCKLGLSVSFFEASSCANSSQITSPIISSKLQLHCDLYNQNLWQSTTGKTSSLPRSSLFNTGETSDQKAKDAFLKVVGRDLYKSGKVILSDMGYFYSSPARMDVKSALWTGAILGVGGVLYAYDQELMDGFQRSRNHPLYVPIRHMGEFFEPLGMQAHTNKYIFGGVIVGYLIGYEPLMLISADILEAYLIAGNAKNAVVMLIGRRRPYEGYGPRQYDFLEGSSLPSGHSSNVFQMATVLSHHLNNTLATVALYTFASSVALQRITDNAHWPSDAYLGSVFGYIITEKLMRMKKIRRADVTPVFYNDGGAGLVYCFKF